MREVTNFAKGGSCSCLPLQNFLLPFASLVRRENKFRVLVDFLVFKILEYFTVGCYTNLAVFILVCPSLAYTIQQRHGHASQDQGHRIVNRTFLLQ